MDNLGRAGLHWLGAFDDGQLVAAVAWQERVDELDIDRLVVDPGSHRRGIRAALVREVLARAGPRPATVSTGRDNAPARALYAGLGFTALGDEQAVPGLWVTRYRHVP